MSQQQQQQRVVSNGAQQQRGSLPPPSPSGGRPGGIVTPLPLVGAPGLKKGTDSRSTSASSLASAAKGPGAMGGFPDSSSAVAKSIKASSGASVKTAGSATSKSRRTSSVQGTELPQEAMFPVVMQCDWIDKTLWISRQLLGGQSVNGFLRATATVQRIKKQRARQTKSTKTDKDKGKEEANSNKRDGPDDQESEESLKTEIMNARTAKKMKQEMDMGIMFCAILHETVRSIIDDMDPNIMPPPPLGTEIPGHVPIRAKMPPGVVQLPPKGVAPSAAPSPLTTSSSKSGSLGQARASSTAVPQSPLKRAASASVSQSSVSSGNASGSTLRRSRKKKLPPSNEPAIPISEFDASGKRVLTKKEYTFRISEILRFRTLRKGDKVAARLSSRDLWILATVQQDYHSHKLSPTEFLQLSQARRDQLFRDKVKVQDVEDKQGVTQLVARSLVLPLPRSFSEAAEWGSRLKKGYRVYAMYPNTTSLYSATVVDCTTYCRGDDDIIVVEFDGDEPDETGQIAKCHIPARFVTLIPRDFPASAPPGGSKSKRRGAGTPTAPAAASNKNSDPVAAAAAAALNDQLSGVLDDDFDLDGDLPGLDFDDLDFNL